MLPRFLTPAEVLDFHEDLVRSFGGDPGVRDLGLLESALAMPRSGSGTTFFHEFPFDMAAAYAFHVARNHPFIDGNKRTALACALVFLEVNGYPIMGCEAELESATRRIASGDMSKKGYAKALSTAYARNRDWSGRVIS